MVVRSALVAFACWGHGHAAASLRSGLEDEVVLLQRSSENQDQNPYWPLDLVWKSMFPEGTKLEVVPYKEAWKEFKKYVGDLTPPLVQAKEEKFVNHVLHSAEVGTEKVENGIDHTWHTFRSGTQRLAEKMNNKRKEVQASLPPIWRKEKNSTDYGVLDGIIESTRSRLKAKRERQEKKLMSKVSELGRQMIEALPQPMMPAMTPINPMANVMHPGAGNQMTADEMAQAVEAYRRQYRQSMEERRERVKEHNEEVETNRKREAEEAEAQKQAEQEVKQREKEEREEMERKRKHKEAVAANSRMEAEQRDRKRRASAAHANAVMKQKKEREEKLANSDLFEEGVV